MVVHYVSCAASARTKAVECVVTKRAQCVGSEITVYSQTSAQVRTLGSQTVYTKRNIVREGIKSAFRCCTGMLYVTQ